ncbi:MAG: hypothetical protein HY369_04325 [Candidatus Aenigmarchaeota archaeon]|nr:hypothetical protein [Candidatus Aenigmarchaeota archaeon]
MRGPAKWSVYLIDRARKDDRAELRRHDGQVPRLVQNIPWMRGPRADAQHAPIDPDARQKGVWVGVLVLLHGHA